MYYLERILGRNQSDILPVWFGYESCKPGHYAKPGERTYWLVHYVISGKGVFYKNENKYELSKGWIFTISPTDDICYKADLQDPWTYTWIAFKMDQRLSVTPDPILYIPEAAGVFSEMRRSKKMINGKEAFLCGKIWELLSLIMEGHNDSMDHIEKALQIIHAEYTTKITVEQIAERIHLDKTYFSHAFRKKMNISPKQYLTNLRMEQARSLIQQHKYSVTEAAASVGYDNIYLFSKMFKRHFGAAPTKL